MVNYYTLLEISENASVEVIRAAYKVKVKQYHPDNYTGKEEQEMAGKKLQLFNEAVAVLTDPEQRKAYDRMLSEQGSDTENTFEKKSRENSWGKEAEEKYDDEAIRDVQSMILSVASESEYLKLHQRISVLKIPESKKASMHSILDGLTAIRLENELALAKEYGNYQKEAREAKNGMFIWFIIGFIVSAWFEAAFLIGLALGILTYCGGKESRQNLEKAKIAEQHISAYRQNGFQIW